MVTRTFDPRPLDGREECDDRRRTARGLHADGEDDDLDVGYVMLPGRLDNMGKVTTDGLDEA